jgi:hypothetical protein
MGPLSLLMTHLFNIVVQENLANLYEPINIDLVMLNYGFTASEWSVNVSVNQLYRIQETNTHKVKMV